MHKEMNMFLIEQDYIDTSKLFGVEVALIKTVAEVESRGSGFLDDGKCKILFEPYQFSKLTERQYDGKTVKILDEEYPISLSGAWSVKACKYGSTNIQWYKYQYAQALDNKAAMMACSWGLFQIMGFNYKLCGYENVYDFVKDMVVSEKYHLLAVMQFIKNTGLEKHLKNKDWAKFAKGYNGSSYAQNKYDVKLQKAYEKFSS